MWSETLHDQGIAVVSATDAANVLVEGRARRVIARDREITLVIALAQRKSDLPSFGESVRGQRRKPVLEFDALVSVEIAVQLGAEHPVIPGITNFRGNTRWSGVTDHETRCDRRPRREAHQAESHGLRDATANIILGVGGSGNPPQRVDAPGKPLQADQGHGVFAASTRAL